MELKKCSACKIEKPLFCFSKDKSRKSGLKHMCKDCAKLDKSKRKNDDVRTHLVDVLRVSKRTSKTRGIYDYDIDVEYILELYKKQNGLCAISNIEMTHISGKGNIATNISIDRIDNSKGYVKGNIQLLCCIINSFKSTTGNDDFCILLNKIAKNVYEKNNLREVI